MAENSESPLCRCSCTATYHQILLSPLAEAPEIAATANRLESRLRDDRGTAGRELCFYTAAEAKITLRSRNIGTALELIAGFAVGEDLCAAARRHELVFTPTGFSGSRRSLVFPAACLLPEFLYLPHAERDHEIRLTFLAFPDAAGRLFLLRA